MKTRYRNAGRTCLACMTLLAGIASVSSCSVKPNPNESLTDSNRVEQSPEDFQESGGDGGAGIGGATAGAGSANGTGSGQGGSQSQLTSLVADAGSDGFALWSQGKLSVTDGTGSNLLFEIDPTAWRTRTWANLEIDGALAASGGVRSEWMATSGSVRAGSLLSGDAEIDHVLASDLSTEALNADDLQASAVKATGLEADSSVFGKTIAEVAQAASLSSDYAVLSEAGVGYLAAEDVSAASISAVASVLRIVDAVTANVENLNANSASIGSLSAGSVDAGSVGSSNLSAQRGEFGSLSSGSMAAGTSTFGSVSAESASLDSLSAGSIAGALDGFRVDSSSAGIAAFASVGADGDGSAYAATITTDPGVDALMVTPLYQGDQFQVTYEVENLGEGTWRIIRRFPQEQLEEMSQGTFAPIGERYACWLAVDFG